MTVPEGVRSTEGTRPDTPLVSVIVPCYNTAAYVSAAVESALAQTYARIEVVVVNDGSTDDTAERLAAFGDRIVVVTQPNGGLSAARNRGIAESRGELIAYLDADDVWHPHKIAYQVRALQEQPNASLVHTGFCKIDGAGGPLPFAQPPAPRSAGWCLKPLIRANGVVVSSVLHTREVMGADRFATELFSAEDWDMWLILASRGPVVYVDFPFTLYRRHGSNMSAVEVKMCAARMLVLERLLERPQPFGVRWCARRAWRAERRAMASLRFDGGQYAEARRIWLSLLPFVTMGNLCRLAATCLPPALFDWARDAWQQGSVGALRRR